MVWMFRKLKGDILFSTYAYTHTFIDIHVHV